MHWAQQKTVAGGSVFLARFTFFSSVSISDFDFVAVETTAFASDDVAETGAAAFRFFCVWHLHDVVRMWYNVSSSSCASQ